MPSIQQTIKLATIEGTSRELVPQEHVIVQIQKQTLRIRVLSKAVSTTGHTTA